MGWSQYKMLFEIIHKTDDGIYEKCDVWGIINDSRRKAGYLDNIPWTREYAEEEASRMKDETSKERSRKYSQSRTSSIK
jgi:hypothetical protein